MGDEIADVEVVMVRAHLKEIYESQEIKIRLSLLYVWYCSCYNNWINQKYFGILFCTLEKEERQAGNHRQQQEQHQRATSTGNNHNFSRVSGSGRSIAPAHPAIEQWARALGWGYD